MKIIILFLISFNILANDVPELLVFTKKNCPHCEDAEKFLKKSDNYTIKMIFLPIEVEENIVRLKKLAFENDLEQLAVPTFYFQGKLLVGFNEERLIAFLSGEKTPKMKGFFSQEISIPFLGKQEIKVPSLFIFTIFLGLIDGFNPCAMWVLLFLLSMLVNIKDRKKVFLIAGTFVFVSGLVYFLFMAAWLNFFILVGQMSFIKKFIASLALVVGFVHIKDFFFFKKVITFSIPDKVLPNIYQQIRKIIEEKELFLIFISTFVLAFLVNLVEFLCTVGLPVVYGQILTEQHLSSFMHYFYLVIYNLAYMADDALMVIIAVWSMEKFKLQEKGGRWLKLLSGGVLVGISGYLLFVV